jgi:hypothetical protein
MMGSVWSRGERGVIHVEDKGLSTAAAAILPMDLQVESGRRQWVLALNPGFQNLLMMTRILRE